MAASHISGPSIVWGSLGGTSTRDPNPEAGPSVTYQGDTIPDVRFPYQPGVTGRGVVRALLDSPYVASVDAVPATNSATLLVNAAVTPTSGTALTLATTNAAGLGVAFPIVPAGSSYTAANVKSVWALDPGFCACSTAGTTVTLTNANYQLFAQHFQPGMTLLISHSTTGTSWAACRIITAAVIGATYTTFTVDTTLATIGTNGATGVAAIANGQFRGEQTPLAASPWLTAGATAVFDPRSGLARGLRVVTTGSNTGAVVTVSGYDVYGYPMSEAIACATATTFYGKKCFKYITQAVPTKNGGGAFSGNVSLGTSDVFGFNTRSDAWEYTNVFWAGAFMSSTTGWVAADTTTPATTTTGDVRGTIQASALGGGSGIGSNSSDGSRRLQIFMSIPQDNLFAGTPDNPTPMFGTTQV